VSGSSDQRLSIRLSFDGAQEARAQLEQLGQVGDTAMRKLEAGGQAAGRGVAAISAAGDALRSGLGQINGDLANTGRQFEDLARSTVGLAAALRTGAGLAGAISGVVAVAGAAYAIFQNWDAISKSFGGTIDWLTGRYRSNGEELKKVNDLLVDFSRLSETVAQRSVRVQVETLSAMVTQAQSARQALSTDIANMRNEIDRQVGFAPEEIGVMPAPTAPRRPDQLRGNAVAAFRRQNQEAVVAAESDPAIIALRRDLAGREGALADLDRQTQFLRAQIAGLGEATGSLLNAPPPPPGNGGGGGGRGGSGGGGRGSTRQELTDPQREYQRLMQQGIQLAGTAATEQERYAEQVRALSVALGAARITQEQYNAAVAALDPAARAAREAQEQAARQAEQFARRSRDALAQIGETAMDRIGTGLVNAFTSGGKAALDFQSLMRGVTASIAADLLKLAVVTPITNSIFGTARPTLMGAFGGGAQSSAPAVGASGMPSVGIGEVLGFSGLLGGGSSGGMFSGLGASLGLSGAGGLLSTPLFTTSAGAMATAPLPAGVMGPVLPATALGPMGMGTTFGSLLGGAGAGFGAGMLTSSLVGSQRGTVGPGGTIGAGGGALAGALIGSIIPGVGTLAGGLIGGALGGGGGAMFGPTKSGMAARSGGDVFLGTDANGQLVITSARGKRFDEGAARAEVQAQLDAINQQIGARGLSFAGAGQNAVGFGQASGSPRELSMTSLVGQLRSGNANQMAAFGNLAGRGGNLEQALQAADFISQIFEPLGRAENKTGAFTQAMEALTKTYDEAITKARDLGLSESDLQARRAEQTAQLNAERWRDYSIMDRSLGERRATLAGDTRGAGLIQFDLQAEAENRAFRDQLRNLGFDDTTQEFVRQIVELEQIVADERLAVMRQFDQQAQAQAEEAARQAQAQADRMRGITQGLLESLTLGDLGGLPLEARYGAALSSLSAAQRQLLDGATPEELAEFARVAQIALPIAKDFLGVSGSFAELVADVSRTLGAAAPSSDPANLGALLEAQVAGADRLELAVIGTGQAQTEVLQSVLTELKRLTSQNEAILARK
jgi:hypothetical protein